MCALTSFFHFSVFSDALIGVLQTVVGIGLWASDLSVEQSEQS